MINRLKKILFPKVKAEDVFNIPEKDKALFESIVSKNREVSNQVSEWVNEDILTHSIYKYGIPDSIKPLINLPIGSTVCYTDYIVYLMNKIDKEVKYLELGVSVCKNFFPVINSQNKGYFLAYDIEEFNPLIKSKLSQTSLVEWDTMDNSLKKTKSSLSTYQFHNNTIEYLCGDVWDSNSWNKLKNKKFNAIFSDAMHDPQALLYEYEKLIELDLIDDKFFIVWDDLVGDMQESFFTIAKKIKKKYKLKSSDIYLIKTNGWLGENYPIKHDVGIITNIF